MVTASSAIVDTVAVDAVTETVLEAEDAAEMVTGTEEHTDEKLGAKINKA